MRKLPRVTIYADGSCLGNPGPGGWACILIFESSTAKEKPAKQLSGGHLNTTNNAMELLACIKALEALKRSCQVQIWTDSKYVCEGATKWVKKWVVKGWKGSNGRQVKNKELWATLLLAASSHDIRWKWVKGHSGDVYNELVDTAARIEAERVRDGHASCRPSLSRKSKE